MKTRQLLLTEDAIRAYSRRGNYHSDAEEAKALGLPGLVAQGVQVAGPAYGVLLDEWGARFLTSGRFECRFVGMVTEDQSVEAKVIIDGTTASFEVTNETAGNVAVVGTASVLQK